MLGDLPQKPPSRGLNPSDASLIEQWTTHLRSQGWAASSVERAVKRLRAFARATPGGLFQATGVHVARYADRQALREADRAGRPADVHAYLRGEGWRKTVAVLTGFYSWCETVRGLGWSPGNPMRGIRRLPPIRRHGGLSPALARCYDRLLALDIRSERDRALIWLVAHGLRVSEVVALRPADVDLGGGKVQVRGRGNRARTVPLSGRGIQMLTPWVPSSTWPIHLVVPWSGRGPSRRLDVAKPGRTAPRGTGLSTTPLCSASYQRRWIEATIPDTGSRSQTEPLVHRRNLGN